jgi:3-oxoacyl-[acyl-carrier protein] reductase
MTDEITILITGTSRGIGKTLAKTYLDRGCKVIGCSRSTHDLDHSNYTHFELDITDEDEVVTMFRDIADTFGKLDVVVNNAGIASMNHSLLTPIDTLEKIYGTNVFGTYLCSREAAKIMRKQETGRIVNFSSVAAPLALEGESAYASSKASVESLTRILAKEFADFGITVNAIGPSPIETDLIDPVSDDKLDDLLDRQAIEDYASPEDVINVIDFYLKPESKAITGQCLWLGGVS